RATRRALPGARRTRALVAAADASMSAPAGRAHGSSSRARRRRRGTRRRCRARGPARAPRSWPLLGGLVVLLGGLRRQLHPQELREFFLDGADELGAFEARRQVPDLALV